MCAVWLSAEPLKFMQSISATKMNEIQGPMCV